MALVAGVCMAFGVDVRNAVFTGCLVSLSSTAIVLKLLSGRGETASPVGEVAVSFLIFQDLAVVVMVLLLPMLAPGGAGGLGDIVGALVKSAVVIVFVLAGTRWFIPRALDKVAENSSDEVFLLSVAAFALIVAYIASALGLTDSLGAFIAGLVISSSRHRERALQYVTPFQMLFSAVFFASIGMLLDISFVIEHWILVVGLAAGHGRHQDRSVSAWRPRCSGGRRRSSSRRRCSSPRSGEFSFVLEQAAGLSASAPPGSARTDPRPSSPPPCSCSCSRRCSTPAGGGGRVSSRPATVPTRTMGWPFPRSCSSSRGGKPSCSSRTRSTPRGSTTRW